jgi:hypothetical protein
MVRIEQEDEATRLDRIVRECAAELHLRLDVNGWARRTYDAYTDPGRFERGVHVARIESFATRSGEILVFDEGGLPFAAAVGERLEQECGVSEAVIKRVEKG